MQTSSSDQSGTPNYLIHLSVGADQPRNAPVQHLLEERGREHTNQLEWAFLNFTLAEKEAADHHTNKCKL